MDRPRQAVLLVNAKSRRGDEWFGPVKQTLSAAGISLIEARAFANARDIPAAVERHIHNKVPLILVGGGDGTISSIARFFAKKETVLGVLPMGTGNAFARDLGMPDDSDAACKVILDGKVARVDMGLIGDRNFVNIATVGLSTKIALGLRHVPKKRLGKAAYLFSLLTALPRVSPFRVRLELPSGDHEFDSLQLVIGNGRFHAGPFPIAPDASITGGWLAIYALATKRKGAFLKMAMHMRGGKHVEMDEVNYFRAQSGRLLAQPMQAVTVDGEVCLKTPVDFGIAPKALRVIVPLDFDENG